MKKLNFLLVALFITVAAFAQEWNFSDASFTALTGDITTVTTVDNFIIFGDPDKDVTIQENGKELNGYTFTHRLKLNGTGAWNDDETTPKGRVLGVPVPGNCDIVIYGMSSSSSSIRKLVIGLNETTAVDTFITGGAAIDSMVVNYTGDATTLYLYSASSGFNLYLVKVAEGTTTSLDNIVSEKSVVNTEYFNLQGTRVMNVKYFNQLPKGLYIKREYFDDGTSKATKILKNFDSGI